MTNTQDTGEEKTGEATVKKVEKNTANALAGVEFKLYANQTDTTALKTYTTGDDGTFTISVNDDGVKNYLPMDGTAKTLYLKETTPKAGYKANGTTYTVTITKGTVSGPTLTDGKSVTTTNYTIAITNADKTEAAEGKTTYVIENEKDEDQEIEHASVTVNKKGANNASLSGATFKLYDNAQLTGTELKTYTGESFTVSTNDLTGLPTTNGATKTYYLVETAAPASYKLDSTAHPVVVTANVGQWVDEVCHHDDLHDDD